MPYKYLVTYSHISMEAGSNPFGHAGIFLSRQKANLGLIRCQANPSGKSFQDLKSLVKNKDAVLLFNEQLFFVDKEKNNITRLTLSKSNDAQLKAKFSSTLNEYQAADEDAHQLLNMPIKDSRIRVIDAFGFFSQKSTTKNPVGRWLKKLLGIKVDLQNTHGILKREEMRDIDVNGVYGVTYAVSQETFEKLQTSCYDKIKKQTEAIRTLKTTAPTGVDRAKQNHRDLPPFHLRIKMTLRGLTTTGSSTCKTYALDLLEEAGIIDNTQKQIMLGSKTQYAFPRFGKQPLAPMRLVSVGTISPYHSPNSKKIFYNREWGLDTKLYWATQPFMSDAKKSLKNAITNAYNRIKKQLNRLRRAELTLHQIANQTGMPISSQMNQSALYKRFIIGHKPIPPAPTSQSLPVRIRTHWRTAITCKNVFSFFNRKHNASTHNASNNSHLLLKI